MFYARTLLCAVLLLGGTLSAAEKTDPRVEEILEAWQRKADGMGSYCVKGRRYVYDSVFEVEKRSKFELAWEKNGRKIYRLNQPDIGPHELSEKIGNSGKPYELKSDLAEIWYLTPRHALFQFNVSEKMGASYNFPSSRNVEHDDPFDLESWLERVYLSILFPYAYVEQLRENFRFEITSQSNESFIWLKAAPVSVSSLQSFSSLEMIVNAETFEIFALKAIDPVGLRETVYRFEDLERDPEFQSETSPFQIDWDDYRMIDSGRSAPKTTSRDLPTSNDDLSGRGKPFLSKVRSTVASLASITQTAKEVADEPDPRIEAILKVWKKKLHSMQTYHLKGSVIEYDLVFEVERHAELEVGFERVGRRIARWTVPKLDPKLKSQRLGKSGEPYGVDVSIADIWHCSDDHTKIRLIPSFLDRKADDETPATSSWQILFLRPPHMIWNLGFLFPTEVENNLERFEWSIIREDENQLTLQAIPKIQSLRTDIAKLEFELSSVDHIIQTIKLTDPSGNREMVLLVKESRFDRPFAEKTTLFDIPESESEEVIAIPPDLRESFR